MILRLSGPAQAMRGAAVVFVVIVAARVPAMRGRFRQAVAAADGPTAPRHFVLPAVARGAAAAVLPASLPDPAPPGEGAADGRRAGSSAHAARMATIVTARAPPTGASLGLAPRVALAVQPGGPPPAVTITLASTNQPPTPFDLATAAYARLAAGDRRGAAGLFDAALADDANDQDPRAAAWRRQLGALTRHWSGSAYSIVRDGGPADLATEPVLGGSQSGGSLAYTFDPLDGRPVAVFARGSIAHDDGGRTSFAAIGVQWRPVAAVTVAAERLIAIGPDGPNDWSLRLGAGVDRTYGRIRATAYGEGGVIGTATYAAAQGRLAGIFHLRGVEIDPGAGVWSSLQHDHGPALDRVDTGPGLLARAGRFGLEADYRVRVAGDAAPGSGPVLTLTAGF